MTAGRIVLIGATNDQRLRAFDARNGAELWSASLPSNANAVPMTYAGRSGKQHVAIVAGDTVLAYALR